MFGWRARLTDDWKDAWKFSSVRFILLGGAIRGALEIPALTQNLPSWFLSGASMFSFAAFVLAGLGRITVVERHDDRDDSINRV